MKPLRSLLVCALALPLVFSACEQQDNLGLDEAGIIRLSASTEGTSRGMPLGAASELTSMGVFCYHTQGQAWAAVAGSAAANRMNNTAWTQSEGTWTSNATVAWEPTDGYNDNFSFFGYTPRGTADNGITVSSTTGTPKLTYTVPAIIGNQPDLMVASAKDVKPTSSAVNMAYKHALTCVAFKGIGAGETISAIKVKGVKTTGTLSLDASSGITWTNLGGELSTEFSAGLSNPGGVVTDGTATGVLAADGYLMMIPQTLTADAKVVVTINNTDYTFALQTAEVSAWAAGQRVTYTINTEAMGVELVDYTTSGEFANSYMLIPNSEKDAVYKIPIGRVNDYWSLAGRALYAGGSTDVSNMISSEDEWTVSLLWQDKQYLVVAGETSSTGITISKPTGTGADAANDGYFTITIPQGLAADLKGNFVVGIAKGAAPRLAGSYGAAQGTILWSWHFWVTDYNPYGTATAVENETATGTPWAWSVPGGLMHRYKDGTKTLHSQNSYVNGITNPWATAYQNKRMMDRYFGAQYPYTRTHNKGLMLYQFGRKDPFPYEGTLYRYGAETVNFSASANAGSTMTFDQAVKDPLTFAKSNYVPGSWLASSPANIVTKIWFDLTVPTGAGNKSIFDPCPYGFKLPENGTWRDFSGLLNYNYDPAFLQYYYTLGSDLNYAAHYYACAGRNGSTGLINGSYRYTWSGSVSSGNDAFCKIDDNGTPSYQASISHAFQVRCIQK